MATEARCSKKLLEALKVPGAQFDKMADRYQVGLPDIIGCYSGLFVAIEVKANDSAVIPAGKEKMRIPSGHSFSVMQTRRLLAYKRARGAALAVIFLGDLVVFADAEMIGEDGRIEISSASVRESLRGSLLDFELHGYTIASAENGGMGFAIIPLLDSIVKKHKESRR